MESFSRQGLQREAGSLCERSNVIVRSATERVRKQKFEDPAIVGVYAGYEITLGYRWSGKYLVWRLEDFVDMDLRQNSYAINQRQLLPCIVRELERVEEGVIYPLKAKYERVNATQEGMKLGGGGTIK